MAYKISKIGAESCPYNGFNFKANGDMICDYKEVETEEAEHPEEIE